MFVPNDFGLDKLTNFKLFLEVFHKSIGQMSDLHPPIYTSTQPDKARGLERRQGMNRGGLVTLKKIEFLRKETTFN